MVCSFPPHVMSCQHFSTEKGYIDLRMVQRTHDRGLWRRGISEQRFSCSCILSPDPWGKNGKTWLPHALDCCLSHRYYPWWLQMTVSSREGTDHGPVNNIYIYIYCWIGSWSIPSHHMPCQVNIFPLREEYSIIPPSLNRYFHLCIINCFLGLAFFFLFWTLLIMTKIRRKSLSRRSVWLHKDGNICSLTVV